MAVSGQASRMEVEVYLDAVEQERVAEAAMVEARRRIPVGTGGDERRSEG